MNLSQELFDSLLAALHADRAAAGELYEKLRERLVNFFRWEGCVHAEDWADEVLNRAAAKIAGAEAIGSVPAYVSGIARLALKEALRAQQKVRAIEAGMDAAAQDPKDDRAAACLEQCLRGLPDDTAAFITNYYRGDAATRIRNRQAMAGKAGISLNSLRNRALRLREKLESCVKRCMERDVSPFPRTNVKGLSGE